VEEDGRAAAKLLLKRLEAVGGEAEGEETTPLGKLELQLKRTKGKKDIYQQRSFENHCVSDNSTWSPELVLLGKGVLPKNVGDNEQFMDWSKRRKRRKFDGGMRMGKMRFMGVRPDVKQDRAKVQFRWKVGKKVKKVTPSKRGVVVSEVVVKPRVMRLGGNLCTVWGELRRWLKVPGKLEIAFIAYEPVSSDSIGVAVRGPTGWVTGVSQEGWDEGMRVAGLQGLCAGVVDEVCGYAALKCAIAANRKIADSMMRRYHEEEHKSDEEALLKKVMMRMLKKQEGTAWNHWVGVVRGMKQMQEAANVIMIRVDVVQRVEVVKVDMRRWTELIRKALGVEDGEELESVSANKAIYFSSKKVAEEGDEERRNLKAEQFAGLEGVKFYGNVVWAMLHGKKAMDSLIEWDGRIVESKVEGNERRREHEEAHEREREETRELFLEANKERARKLMSSLKRGCMEGEWGGGRYRDDKFVAWLRGLRKTAESGLPSEREDPYLFQGDAEEYKEEMERGAKGNAFMAPGTFKPWWVWSVCLRCHAQQCDVGYASCSVPFCGAARLLASNRIENLRAPPGGLGGLEEENSVSTLGSSDDVWKQHVWDLVGELQEEWHLEKEDREDEEREVLGKHKPRDPWERTQYVLKRLKMTGKLMRGF
jgi:hypothetical protein